MSNRASVHTQNTVRICRQPSAGDGSVHPHRRKKGAMQTVVVLPSQLPPLFSALARASPLDMRPSQWP
jgi:hypothetical protein